MRRGFVYLAAVIDWFTRKVLAWRVSITLETAFCIEAVEEAAYSGVIRPPVPIASGHPYRFDPAGDSGVFGPPILGPFKLLRGDL